MFKEISKFQLILLSVFVFFTIAGLITFALFKGGGVETKRVSVWGTLKRSYVAPYFEKVSINSDGKMVITYTEKDPDTFNSELLEALATGAGPDVILIAEDSILKNLNKILTIPYKTLPEQNFKSTFIQEGEIFLNQTGTLAVPFAVDPLVMYWNRDIFTNANLSLPPKYWDEFLTLAPTLTQRDSALNIAQSAVALGEYDNVNHAKDIVSTLMLQAGNPISALTSVGYQTTFSSSINNNTTSEANSALIFYTQFANPLKSMYSWNKALPNSKTLFLSNKLAIYFGYASEYPEIKGKNPNLNFEVATMPQLRPKTGKLSVNTTFGKMYGLAILKTAKSAGNSYSAISLLTSKSNSSMLTQYVGLPSVLRDAPKYDSSSSAAAVFATSALWSKGWLDPDDSATNKIFKDLIDSITSGRSLITDAILDANEQINNLFQAVNKK